MAVKGKGKQIAGKAPAASTATSNGKRKRTRADGESSGAPQKKKPSGVLQFVDDAAADSDFEPEEEEDELEWEIDDDFDFELPDIGAKEVKNVTKGPGKSSPLPFFIKEEEMNGDELEEAIKERYRSSGFVSFDEDVKEYDESLLVDHATKDLSVWRVKCMVGRERQAAFCLMQKFVDLLKMGKKLQIYSVFALDHIKGFFYVEADKACNVFEACNGLCTLYSSRIELVPRNEAPNLLSIQKKTCGIAKGTWVRMKNGKYKGDLAEVVLVNDAKKRLTIKLVPRIDLQAIAKKFGGGTSLKAAAIPAPRLISSHELEDFRPLIEVRRDRETGEIFEVLDGLMLKDGYLYKKVSMGSLIHWGVQPSSGELAKFEDLGKDEVKDVSWLSSIYKARIKKKFPEISHQTNGEKSNQKGEEKSNQKGGEKSNQKDGDKQRNGFDIDDLVLFGKKGCGIIIDKENDTFKVLKGDVNGSEVVSINIRGIKKICVDKVFIATDRCMKTISIDDVVKISEGPLEGREGIVRHMYKGVLFIYDECQSENNGFFCAKPEICDLVKKSRDFGGGKLSSNAGPSFVQSPIRSSEQDDNSQSFTRNRQSNSRGTFSVGQTLRICKGPLKGYLCRVIQMYRADITVKLDSFGKLLTVDEKLLSIPNSKRDDATAMQCDMFGSQEEQSTGGGLGMDNFEFNAGMSSFGRDSWNTPSCSSLSFPKENDSKDQEQGAANSWGKAPSSSAEQTSWNKMENGEKGEDANCKNDADPWNKSSNKEESSTGGWKNDTPVQKTEQTWSTKGPVEGASDAGDWGKAKLSTPDSAGQTLGEDGWNKAASKPHTVSDAETSGWEQNKLPSSDAGGSWNTKGDTAGWNKETSVKDKADGFGEQSSNWASPKSGGGGGGDNVDSWGVKGKGLLRNNDDSWGKSAASQEIKPVANNPWQNSFNSSVQSKSWKAPSADENQAADWGASALESANQTSSWDKVKTAPNHIECEKSEAGATEIGGWKKAADGNQASGWSSSAIMHSGTSSVEDGSQSNSWSKVEQVTESVGGWKSTTDGWGASALPSATPSVELKSQTSSWDKASNPPSSSEWQISKEGWNKEKSSDRDEASGWNKAGNAEDVKDVSTDGWDKAKSSEGSGWSQGHSNNENGNKSWGSGNSWNQQRDFDGGSGSNRGRGRGRYGGRGGRNEDNFEKPYDSDGGWRSGRGGGRYGGRGGRNEDNFEKPNDSDGGWRSGRGGGRYGGRGGRNEDNFEKPNDSDGVWRSGRGGGRYGGRGGRNEDNFENPNDSDGGWRSGRGGGRYGGRGGRNEDNFESPNDSDGGWRSGRGGGRGRNGPGGYNRDNSDTREFGRGRGRGRDRGQDQGQFQSSDWRSRRERFDGGFSNKPSSSWGSAEGGDWGNKSIDQQSVGVMEEKVGWNSGSSYSGGSKPGWGTDPRDAGGSKDAMNEDHTSSWGKAASTDKQTDNWSKETRNNDNLNTSKTIDNNISTWNQTSNDTAKETTSIKNTNAPNSPEASLADWVHGLPESKCTTNDEKWTNKAKSSPGGHGDSQSGWSTKKVESQASQPPSSEIEKNSNDWGDNNSSKFDSCSNAWDSKKEPTSDWNNGGGNRWGNQTGGQGKSENWSRGSDFGGGGGRGRGNSFSSGRGIGRNSGGRHSYGRNSSDDSGKEGSWGSWKPGGESEPKWAASASASVDKVESASGWRDNNNSANSDSQSTAWDSKKEPASHQGNWGGIDSSGSQDKSESWCRGSDFQSGRGRGRDNSFSGSGRGPGRNSGGHGRGYDKEGNGGSWNSEGNTRKGSWGSSNQPAAPAKPWSEAESSKSSWDSPTGFGSDKPDSSKDLVTAKETKTSDGGEQKNDPWGSANASKMGQESTWNSGSSDEKQKNRLSETDRIGSWGTNNVPSEDGSSKKVGSGWNDSAGEDKSSSGNGGGNSGW